MQSLHHKIDLLIDLQYFLDFSKIMWYTVRNCIALRLFQFICSTMMMGYFHFIIERMMILNILVVEDEVQLADTLAEILRRNKYNVDAVFDGEDGLEYARTGIYDCILLDIMLPVRSGIEVVQILRKEKNSTPIMLLTAKSEVEDKIQGLDCGADDYLTKPFSTGELLARIRALTRRKGEVEVDYLHFDELRLSRQTYALTQGENSMKLSLKEYQIMEILMSNPGQIMPKERFIEKIWGYESDVEYNNIEVYISFLRKKLAAIQSTVQIRTARGIGYFLEKKA